MREIFTSGSVGRALGNQCLYPEADAPKARAAELGRYGSFCQVAQFDPSNRLGRELHSLDNSSAETLPVIATVDHADIRGLSTALLGYVVELPQSRSENLFQSHNAVEGSPGTWQCLRR
jgi:hypothetical protein